MPGGSSGGSAAAVAADLCLGATATDTGGSIRQPAAFTGTVGIKPTYGRCSRWGIVAFASSLDQAGPIATTVEDAAILLRSMAGHDPKDSTSLPTSPVPDFAAAVGKAVKGLRIGVPKEYRVDGMPAEIEALWQQGIAWLKDAGARSSRSPCRTPNTRCRPTTSSRRPRPPRTSPATTACATACASTAPDLIEIYEHTRAAGFGAEVQAPHPDRHLRALGRLLRRLLPEGAEGPPLIAATSTRPSRRSTRS